GNRHPKPGFEIVAHGVNLSTVSTQILGFLTSDFSGRACAVRGVPPGRTRAQAAGPTADYATTPPRIADISCCNRTGKMVRTERKNSDAVAPDTNSFGMNSPDFCLTIGVRPEPSRLYT